MEKIARLFRNGRNQAVRLPVEFEFDAEQVYVSKKENGDILLSLRLRNTEHWQRLFELLPAVVCDETFLDTKERNQSFEQRDPFEVA